MMGAGPLRSSPRPLLAAALNLALEAGSVGVVWVTGRVELGAVLFCALCLPLSIVVLFSIVRELDSHPYACRERRAAQMAGVLWMATPLLGLGMVQAMSLSPLSLIVVK